MKKLIKKHIVHLKKELSDIRERAAIYPKGSFGEARLNLATALWEFKIALWESLI